ncbi:hypothetical protein [Agrobacterium radiobacter]|uniref:hypothetical protein n=1 Tax=Agrobacterium radiobacter TaxID=362 RepID=UPI003F831CC1
MSDSTWPIETEDEVEALARECDWDNRKFMTVKDYSIWCERMRKFARLATTAPSNDAPAPVKEWRCFHCDEVFTTEHDARLHFGMDQCSDPACKIKLGAEKSLLVALRRAETELQDAWAAIHNENTEAAKAYYAQQSRHGEQLRAAEELGFERGIADLGSIWEDLKSLSNAANDLASWAGSINWRGGENQKDWLDELRQHIESVQALCKPYLPKSEAEA